MSCQVKCGKCGVLFDKTINPKRKNDYYRTCKLCRDKINGIVPCKYKLSAKSKPVEPELNETKSVEPELNETKSVEPEQPNDFNWKAIVFGNKSKSKAESEPRETDSVEPEKPITEDESDHESETPIKSDVDNSINDPIISSAYLQSEITPKQETVSEKLKQIMELLETKSAQLKNQSDGFNTSTKCVLEQINSNVVQAMMKNGTCDTNYNAYEIKVDKLATRISELETNLKLFISTTIDLQNTSHNLKRCILDSEENLKNALQLISNKI